MQGSPFKEKSWCQRTSGAREPQAREEQGIWPERDHSVATSGAVRGTPAKRPQRQGSEGVPETHTLPSRLLLKGPAPVLGLGQQAGEATPAARDPKSRPEEEEHRLLALGHLCPACGLAAHLTYFT